MNSIIKRETARGETTKTEKIRRHVDSLTASEKKNMKSQKQQIKRFIAFQCLMTCRAATIFAFQLARPGKFSQCGCVYNL